MSLPFAANAVVPPPKITDYLLDPLNCSGASKANFFLAHGYTLVGWQMLARDLLAHGRAHPVTGQRPTEGGDNYRVDGPLTMPDGVTRRVRSVWYIPTNGTTPRLVSAYPIR